MGVLDRKVGIVFQFDCKYLKMIKRHLLKDWSHLFFPILLIPEWKQMIITKMTIIRNLVWKNSPKPVLTKFTETCFDKIHQNLFWQNSPKTCFGSFRKRRRALDAKASAPPQDFSAKPSESHQYQGKTYFANVSLRGTVETFSLCSILSSISLNVGLSAAPHANR